jgi:SOS-response transcriptional repressor LexA
MCYIMVETIGERIKELRKQRRLTQEELAEKVGISSNYLAMIEVGKRQGKFIIKKIAEKLEVDEEVLYGDQPIPDFTPKPKSLRSIVREFEEKIDSMEVLEIPIVGYVPAGNPRLEEGQNLGFVHPLKSEIRNVSNTSKLFAVIVDGESLAEDGIHSGDRLLIDPVSDVDIQGKIYICVLSENGVVARHVSLTKDGKYRLKSANKHYEDIEPENLIIKGRAIRKMPEEEDL